MQHKIQTQPTFKLGDRVERRGFVNSKGVAQPTIVGNVVAIKDGLPYTILNIQQDDGRTSWHDPDRCRKVR